MPTVLIGPTELLFPTDQGEHVKAWRWYWFRRGVEKLKPRYWNGRVWR